jgi:spermidine/putrescine transport system substrate-binding protein
MENEGAWIAPYYAGDYLTMAEENEDLAFYLPENEGFNLFLDSTCIPTCSKNKEAAETFINFLCRPDIAGGNMDWICYSTPISAAKEYMDPEVMNDPVSYPSEEVLSRGDGYIALPRTTTRLMEELFMQVRNGIPIHLPD